VSSAAAERATAFAPASIGNVAVGFDILGLAVDVLGDRVTVARRSEAGVGISVIDGVVRNLPLEARNNTAGRALEAMLEHAKPGFGLDVTIEKGIPLGSGLGGSASSAVAAVVAANAVLGDAYDKLQLLKFAMQGEAVASGSLHVDNVAPSLFGGLVLTVGIDDPRVKRIPGPRGVRAVAVHPHMELATKQARAILSPTVTMSSFVWQSANLAGLIAACYTDDIELIRASLEDVIIEPQRQSLIPGAVSVRDAAMHAGALGCSISGAGPTMFAWALEGDAERVCTAMQAAFTSANIKSDGWVVEIESPGARLVVS
jgi:homoserine kinase